MSTEYVYGAVECTTFHKGAKVRVHLDEAWDASDPFVKARPELFSGTPEKAQTTDETKPTKRAARRGTKS